MQLHNVTVEECDCDVDGVDVDDDFHDHAHVENIIENMNAADTAVRKAVVSTLILISDLIRNQDKLYSTGPWPGIFLYILFSTYRHVLKSILI